LRTRRAFSCSDLGLVTVSSLFRPFYNPWVSQSGPLLLRVPVWSLPCFSWSQLPSSMLRVTEGLGHQSGAGIYGDLGSSATDRDRRNTQTGVLKGRNLDAFDGFDTVGIRSVESASLGYTRNVILLSALWTACSLCFRFCSNSSFPNSSFRSNSCLAPLSCIWFSLQFSVTTLCCVAHQ
jgi:hypothetical protein